MQNAPRHTPIEALPVIQDGDADVVVVGTLPLQGIDLARELRSILSVLLAIIIISLIVG